MTRPNQSMPAFVKEADLCAAFIEALPKDWTAYPETGGFDILLARADGFQIGVEAKLKLNAKVICQAAESDNYYVIDGPNPDCRAVLIPEGVSLDLAPLCPLLGITVIRMQSPAKTSSRWSSPFHPSLPDAKHSWVDSHWSERAPEKRITLPDWVPDVAAGDSAPISLTPWKVKAIKIAVTASKRGFVTRKDFAHFQISMPRWTQGKWIVQDGNGGWIAGPYLPDFKAQHPVNYPQIEADFEKWKNPAVGAPKPKQEALL